MKGRTGLRGRAAALALLPIYITALVFVVGPLAYMLALSFLSRAETWGVELTFTVRNYLGILAPVYLQTFRQSLRLAFLCTTLIALIGYPFGYFMARLPQKWRRILSFFLVIPIWTSSLMRLYGWIIIFRAGGVLDSLLMKTGVVQQSLKLLYTYPAVVTGMVYVLLPFMIYSVYASAEKMDWNLVEAARDLGAGKMQAFFTITFRLTTPGLLSGVVLTFIPSMGLFFVADILGGNKVVLVGSVIQEQLMKAHNWPFAAAFSVVLMILTSLLIYLYRRITKVRDLEGLV